MANYFSLVKIFKKRFSDKAEAMKLFEVEYRNRGLLFNLNRVMLTDFVLKVSFWN